jgi:SAM-dependent methyltransferase
MRREAKKIGKLVRQVYEERPYPSTLGSSGTWSLVPRPWLNAICHRSADFRYQKVFIAGCGTGDEAFRMRRSYPNAEIVAIDFSQRSIALARRLQRKRRQLRSIRFEVADLSARELPKLTGPDFDFISCHGVLSYILRAEAVLRNLARCLKPHGVLYLGVNGLRHPSVALRETLPLFGFDIAAMKVDDAQLRKVLRLCDAIAGRVDGVAKLKPELLAGDVFGPLILNFSLAKWVRLARRAGLHFRGSYYGWRAMRSVIAADDGRLLLARSRAKLCQLADSMCPSSFHRLIFTREPETNPPWHDAHALRKWFPHWTGLYRRQIPKPSRRVRSMRSFQLTSPSTNTRLDWCLREWALQVLRQANGRRSLDEIARSFASTVPRALMQRHLYLFHQLLVVTMLPSQHREPEGCPLSKCTNTERRPATCSEGVSHRGR